MKKQPQNRTAESREYLKWAKQQGGNCCVCRYAQDNPGVPGVELYDIGESGMGRKGSDYMVARVCKQHHRAVEGKRWVQHQRAQTLPVWAALNEDALKLLDMWIRSGRQEPEQGEMF